MQPRQHTRSVLIKQLLLQNTAVSDHNLGTSLTALAAHGLDHLHDVHALLNLPHKISTAQQNGLALCWADNMHLLSSSLLKWTQKLLDRFDVGMLMTCYVRREHTHLFMSMSDF